jgi:hypothetical protein
MVLAVLRCYPSRWRRRHGDEAAELAALLIRDGTPVRSIALSYLGGAAREWCGGRRARVAAGALVAAICALGLSAGLMASAVPARADSTNHGHTTHCQVTPTPTTHRGAGHGRTC